ncbi:MAG TPA: hypothetical protein PKH24_12775 [Sedimentisphaerales bacterium]|jgi:hypothetical protein|nr:hypothetical protein [Sedimentisphaerales bacterium]HNU30236.1 hypothetical protein [Sedimentisphaerales bacterium]
MSISEALKGADFMVSPELKGYRTVGIDTQIPWPAKEQVVTFRGREFQLLPGTDTLSRMIRVKTEEGFTREDADKLILELFSSLAWAKQAKAVPTYGNWCTAPLNIGKGPTGMIGAGHFDYLPDPSDPKAKLALALYREGLSVNLIPYQFLGFFKVINIIRNGGEGQKQWIRDNLQYVSGKDILSRIEAIRARESDVANYFYVSGRCAVAHAFDQTNVVNPDDPAHLIRLSEDLPVIRELARVAVEREFGIKSERDFHHEHLYELGGFRSLFGDALVARIKAGEEVPPGDVPLPSVLSLRLRDRDRIGLFESMNATVVWVRNKCVCVRLESTCRRMEVFVRLHFGCESLVSDPLTDVQYHDDGTPDAAKMMLQWAQLHRWWFGGNGVIEFWDATGKQLARSQPYMPPVNSRFPHDGFEKMEAELRARAGIPDPPKDVKS